MKHLILTLTSLLFLSLLHAQTIIEWQESIQLIDAEQYGNTRPRIVNNGESTHLLWAKTTNPKAIYTARYDGETLSDPIAINGEVSAYAGIHEGPSISTHNDQVFIVFDGDQGSPARSYLSYSQDGGLTYSNPIQIPAEENRNAYLANVYADESGNAIISFISTNLSYADARYMVIEYNANNQSFSQLIIASDSSNGPIVCECCPSEMISLEDNYYLAFRNNTNNVRDIWISQSTNDPYDFDTATDMDDTNWQIAACPVTGPDLAIWDEDHILSVWASSAEGFSQVYISALEADDMQADFQSLLNEGATNEDGIQNYPRIATSTDQIATVWEVNNTGNIDIYRSTATELENIGTNAIALTNQDGNQRNPDIAYGNNAFHLIYQDDSDNAGLYYQKGILIDTSSTANQAIPKIKYELYPNPANEQLFIYGPQLSNEALISLYSMDGNLISQPRLQGKNNITINHLKSGLYYLQIVDGDTYLIDKFVKK